MSTVSACCPPTAGHVQVPVSTRSCLLEISFAAMSLGTRGRAHFTEDPSSLGARTPTPLTAVDLGCLRGRRTEVADSCCFRSNLGT